MSQTVLVVKMKWRKNEVFCVIIMMLFISDVDNWYYDIVFEFEFEEKEGKGCFENSLPIATAFHCIF